MLFANVFDKVYLAFHIWWVLIFEIYFQQEGKRSSETAIKAPKTARGRQDALTVSYCTHTHNKPCQYMVIMWNIMLRRSLIEPIYWPGSFWRSASLVGRLKTLKRLSTGISEYWHLSLFFFKNLSENAFAASSSYRKCFTFLTSFLIIKSNDLQMLLPRKQNHNICQLSSHKSGKGTRTSTGLFWILLCNKFRNRSSVLFCLFFLRQAL